MDLPADPASVEAALRSERRFVLALGGYALEIPGAVLVTHEKIPSPRFNYVLVGPVAVDRQAAFFERALDHYFQRALRPRFRVPRPVPEHVDRGLRRFAFRSTEEPLELLLDTGRSDPARRPGVEVRPVGPGESDLVASFWTEEEERPELHAALEVAVHHPSPGEELTPLLARVDGHPVAAALMFRSGGSAGIHLVTTRVDARGQGAASALVEFAAAQARSRGDTRCSILSDSPRISSHLVGLGFAVAATFAEYELPGDAELSLPPPGPAGPARWRPKG
ncbi:MAG: GNAT family N-acetyltransferase [Thermoplasmata archaeon]